MQFYWYVNGTRDEKADNYESYSWTLTQTTTFTLVVYDIPTGCESQAAVTITVTPPQSSSESVTPRDESARLNCDAETLPL